MPTPPLHAVASTEERDRRVTMLQSMAVLDTPPEDGFDALTRLAANVCDTPIAFVSLIDGDRLWFKSAHGVSVSEIDSRQSFCCEAATAKRVLEVVDASLDPRFCGNGLVTGELGIRYYAGAPIVHDGIGIGTVCVLDRVPRTLTADALRALEDMAAIAVAMLRARVEAFRLLSGSPA